MEIIRIGSIKAKKWPLFSNFASRLVGIQLQSSRCSGLEQGDWREEGNNRVLFVRSCAMCILELKGGTFKNSFETNNGDYWGHKNTPLTQRVSWGAFLWCPGLLLVGRLWFRTTVEWGRPICWADAPAIYRRRLGVRRVNQDKLQSGSQI